MSNIEEATERVAEFARQYRMRLDVPADGKIYTVWIDPNAEEATLNLNDLEALTAAAPAIQAAALREAAGEADDRAEAAHEVSQNRAAHDFPTRVRYAAYAEEARCIAHVLRARADQLEGETK